MFGPPEIAVLVMLVVLLFGANKIPKLARAAGQAQGELKKGRQEVKKELSGQTSNVPDSESESSEEKN